MKIDWLKVCKKIGKESSKELMRIYNSGNRRKEMGRGFGGDITIEADKKSEDIVIKNLEKLNVCIHLISEERGEIKCGLKEGPLYYVIVDPLDGSFNFKNGIDYFGVSIAVLDSNYGYVIGYIRNAVNKDEYYALKGKGSYKNGKLIKPSSAEISRNTLFEISPKASRADFEFLIRSFLNSRHNRGMGAVVLDFGLVADGTFDALVYAGATRFLDVAAGIFLVRQAGGIVTDFSGNEQIHKGTKLISRNIIAAANRKVLENFLKQRFILEQK
ncbi:TPA: hypothetical protein H1016_02120 [archaeon]|uniref:Inositol monophosphatase n=1 Tax=Candidatus Naiadarchaeum limnaeum TaxID=2756139 RepID=A0A832VA08_9ARCH|nr:hypothetical protein [Candidatus Naiadarchaeum limnaeum]